MNKLKLLLIFMLLVCLKTSILGQINSLSDNIDSLTIDERQIVSDIYNTAELIDSEAYPSIKNKFKIETINNKAFGAFLGGLTPMYKITSALKLSDKGDGLYPLDCRKSEKITLVIELDGQYEAIETQEDLYEVFRPIDSPQEALSFVHLREGGLPLTVFGEEDTFFEQIADLKTIESTDSGYLIRLVVYDPCGMHGEASLNTYSIDSFTGDVTITDTQPLRGDRY